MNSHEVLEYAHITQSNASCYRDGFVAAYQEAFGGPPYFEHYEPRDVIDKVWTPHLALGVIVIAHSDQCVIGFGCAEPVTAEKDIAEFLELKLATGVLNVPLDSMWYMSELGVLASHRRRGIGMALITQRLLLVTEQGIPYYVMRTAAQGSNSCRLYRHIGAVEIPGLQDVSASDQVTESGSQSTQRVYLYGNCIDAIRRIAENHQGAA